MSIHHKNIRSFAIEIYKIKNNMSTPMMSELFEKRNLNYNLLSRQIFRSIQSIPLKCGALFLLTLEMPEVLKNSRLKLKAGYMKVVHVGCV